MQGILTSTIRKIFCNNFQQKNKRLQIGITRSAPVAGDDHSLTANLAARPRLLSSGCGERVSVRALLAKLVTFAFWIISRLLTKLRIHLDSSFTAQSFFEAREKVYDCSWSPPLPPFFGEYPRRPVFFTNILHPLTK